MGISNVIFDEKPHFLRNQPKMTKNQALGKQGEQLAMDYLKEQGYQIVRRNYRYLQAEIDIIARKKDQLVVVEVKFRQRNFFEDLSQTVNKKKRNLLIMAADQFIQSHELDLELRFDVITIIQNDQGYTIEHMESAFYHF